MYKQNVLFYRQLKYVNYLNTVIKFLILEFPKLLFIMAGTSRQNTCGRTYANERRYNQTTSDGLV